MCHRQSKANMTLVSQVYNILGVVTEEIQDTAMPWRQAMLWLWAPKSKVGELPDAGHDVKLLPKAWKRFAAGTSRLNVA